MMHNDLYTLLIELIDLSADIADEWVATIAAV